jgi:hypothetical protein
VYEGTVAHNGLVCAINGYGFNINNFSEYLNQECKMRLTLHAINPNFENGLKDMKLALDKNGGIIDIMILNSEGEKVFHSAAYKIENINFSNEGESTVFNASFLW